MDAEFIYDGQRQPVQSRALKYRKRVDAETGSRIEEKVHSGSAPKTGRKQDMSER